MENVNIKGWHKGVLEVMELVHNLIIAVVTQIYTWV